MPRKRNFLVFLLLVSALSLTACGKAPKETSPPQPPPVDAEEEAEEEVIPPQPLKKVSPVMAVVDNNPRALPHSGLQQATLVYEFLVEGGVTRYLVLFDTLPETSVVIGPVRSLRPYLAYQAAEHGGAVAHSGYSQATREQIRGLSLKHITSATYLYRDSSRKAPHNLYTDTEKLYKAGGHDGSYTEAIPEPPLLPSGYEEGREVKVEYSRNNVVSYSYDEDVKMYARFINGNPHLDRDSELQYTARRIILRQARHASVPGTNLVEIDLTGKGQGFLYEEGRRYSISWVREGDGTRYYFADGRPVDLSYGNTWIQVVR